MRWILLVATVVLGASCSKSDSASAPTEEPQEAIASSIGARWVVVQPAKDASMLSAPCVARADAHATGEVSSAFRVQVKLVHVQVGDVVQEGQAIVDVTAPEIVSAAATYLGLASRLKVHRQRLDALGELRKEGMVRSAAVFEQQALVAEISAGMREAAAVLKLAQLSPKDAGRIAQSTRLTLKAPVAGVVASIAAHPGEVLDGSMTFAEIIGPARARIEVSSPGALAPGESLTMVTSEGQRYDLHPKPISTVVEADTGTHQTWFELKDSTVVLSDGLRCSVQFSVSEDVWEIPVGAVATAPEGPMVWRRRGAEVKRISVQIFSGSGASILVRGDIAAGDFVSADGTAGGPRTP